MINNEELSGEEMKEFWLNVEENRLQTFKDWPFTEDCTCTPDRMAAAGFYHCPTVNEPDLVKCVICGKELDGWEPTDDPWSEHVSHSPQCPFVQLKGPKWNEMTVKQFCELELARWNFLVTKEMDAKIAEVEAYMEDAREELLSLKDSI